ncbi:Acetyltransferase (GNAT) family protein [Friedmanniella luteola]|uniref:Acetyltransferase (GNAT) family protein n=1 Tax=Friedmanniella luteola TaxID=546871 RepID=A0A1H1NGQ3_9ACTN|nr:GNAT family N-acetyltransferase [Friedmanniella luteola]SDR97955.1 Acetyltransferase (GNAT) family protein [Friedmanniella luteola]
MPADDPLAPAAPGQRWVVRHRLPDGSATDVTGWVDQLAPGHVHLGTADGQRHVVDRSTVLAARRAPAAAGGPPPERTSADELEHLSVPGWLALAEPLGEWTLRAGGGFTGRANSCHAVGDPGVDVAEAARRVVAHAAAHGIPPLASVVDGGEPEAALRGLGWVDAYVPTDVLAVRLADLLGTAPPDARARVTLDLEVGWWNAYGESRPNDADPGLLRLVLAGHPPRAFGSTGDPARPTAIGRGHLSGAWLGCAALWTRPEDRRQGLATAVLRRLGHWAARHGARYAYLQVATANAEAHAAYERLGFRRHHAYRYLAPPRTAA